MKRFAALMLAMVMLCTASVAFAWDCPNCGASMEGKFCSECGTKKPENICPSCGANHGDKALKFCTECGAKMGAEPAAAPVQEAAAPVISQVIEIGDGSVSICWEADGKTAYTIECVQRLSDDPWADRAADNGFYTSKGKDASGDYNIARLIPGRPYWIGLFDEEGKGQFVSYEPSGDVVMFHDFPHTVEGKPMLEKNGRPEEVTAFTAQEISGGANVGFQLAFTYSNPDQAREALIQLAILAPNGASWVRAGQLTFEKTPHSVTGWNFISLSDYFARLQKSFGSIPVGDYTVIAFVDGELGREMHFQVEEDSGVSGLKAMLRADGTVDLSWEGGVAPYRVRFMEKRSNDYKADETNPASFGQWIVDDQYKETTCNLIRLAPGRPYWLSVVDANGDSSYIEYAPAAAEVLQGYSTSLDMVPCAMIGEEKTNLASIPAEKAGLEDEVSYGAFLWVDYNNPGQEVDVLLQVVLTLPNGAVCVDKAARATLQSGQHSVGWNFCDMEKYMARVIDNFGAVPVGDIQVECYLNGKLAASGVLPVRETQPLQITGCTRQEDGKVLLTWEDNGNGPYNVYYHQRFSDDVQADRRDARGSGYWIAGQDIAGTSLVMEYLMPGASYWITLLDSADTKQIISYTLEGATASELNMTMTAYPRYEQDEVYTDLTSFPAAALNEAYAGSYGLYIDLDYEGVPADTAKACQVVITLPDGVSLVDYAFDINLFADGSTYWEIYDLDWFFGKVKEWYNEVLPGQYVVTFYVEGKLAASTVFTVAP